MAKCQDMDISITNMKNNPINQISINDQKLQIPNNDPPQPDSSNFSNQHHSNIKSKSNEYDHNNSSQLKTSSQQNQAANTVNKFIEKLNSTSSFRKLPKIQNNLLEKALDIIDDKAFFERKEKNQMITKFFKTFKIISLIKSLFINVWNNDIMIINLYENYKIFCDVTIFSMIMLFLFFLPLDTVFKFENSQRIRLTLSIFILFDDFLGFNTAYFYHGKLIKNRKNIIEAYFLYFIYDLLTQLSLLYDIFFEENDKFDDSKLIKLVFLLQYKKFNKIYKTIIDRFKLDMKFSYILDFINLIMTMLFIIHYLACAWYSIAIFYPSNKTWLDLLNIKQKNDLDKYLYALYWSAITTMTVGYGDITPQNTREIAFVIGVVIIGCGLFAYYIK